MDYLHQYPDGTLRYYASEIILICEEDSAYLNLSKARSRDTAWFILSNDPNKHDNFMRNAPIYTICLKIKNIMASAAECKTGGIFMNIQCA